MLACEWFTAATLADRYGLQPEQWIDYQALVGDKGDNVTGCPSIGKVTATALLQAAGSLDAAAARPFELPLSAWQRSMFTTFCRTRLETVRRLVRLRDDVPVGKGWEQKCRS